jgi:hypothetical protein
MLFHADASYTVWGDREDTDELALGLAGELEILKGLNFVSEVRYGQRFNTNRKDDPATFLAGVQAEWANAVFDTGIRLGLNSAAPDHIFTIGVTLKLN